MSVQKLQWPAWPVRNEQTVQRMREVIESGRWAISGAYAGEDSREQRFATEWAKWMGSKHCVTLDHGTSALIAALEALDVGYGDEVIVPGMTWVAPAIAALSVNATPVIVDIEPETFCMSVEKARAAITPRTKVLLPVHLYGCLADLDGLTALAKQHNLKLVEDACHTHGSEWKGKKAGTFGDIGVFSMQQGKLLTSGEGGAAITDNDVLKDRLEMNSWNARRRLPNERRRIGDLDLIEADRRFGTNRCISEFQAAILLDALPRLEEQNRHRERNQIWLDQELAQVPGCKPMKRLPQVTKQSLYSWVVRIDPKVFGATAHDLIKPLQEMLNLGNFVLHRAYQAMTDTSLYTPHVKRHALEPHFRAAVDVSKFDLPVSRDGYNNTVVFHHSALLAGDENMKAIRDAFITLQRQNQAHASGKA